jgi:hypothetical protein
MIADFFTKPLQGSAFTDFRDFIMNVSPNITSDCQEYRSVLNNICTSMGAMQDDEEDSAFVLVTRKYRNKKSENRIDQSKYRQSGDNDRIGSLNTKANYEKKRRQNDYMRIGEEKG